MEERNFSGRYFKYVGSEATKVAAQERAKKLGKPYRVTQYGRNSVKWNYGYDIWVYTGIVDPYYIKIK